MTIAHHPDVSSLLVCAAGSQPEARAAVIAAHLSMCPACRAEVARMHEIGVALFDRIEPAALSGTTPAVVLRAAEAAPDESGPLRGRCVKTDGDMPGPLVPLLGPRLDAVSWRWIAPGVHAVKVPLSAGSTGELRLLKIAPGTALPEHGHTGQELTLVLRGSYTDALGTFAAGDVADLDADCEHQPVACREKGCICLMATDGKLRFKGFLPRLLQPLFGL